MTHKDFLFYVLDILDFNNIPYVLFAGTLLGAIRENNFLSNDVKDTDIAVDEEHYWKIRAIFDYQVTEKQCKWGAILRKELSIHSCDNNYKVDIFAMETIGDKYTVYSYKPNPQDRRWNHEWRAFFTKEAFFPVNKIEFLGREVSVPNDFDKVLTEEYGDWRTPKPKWISSDNTVLNNDNTYKGFYPAGLPIQEYVIDLKTREIGFICINFLRKECTKKCILSLKKHWPNVKIYVADQDEPTGEMIYFYEKNNVEYYYLPYDCGLSVCRNFLVDKVKEPFFMWGDNDFVYGKNDNLHHAIELLNHDPEIGFVGGAITQNGTTRHYERIFNYIPKYGILVYIPLELTDPIAHKYRGITYYNCDLTFNHVICRTKDIQSNEKLRWNPELKVRYEHSDMFLRIKQFNNLKVVYCPSMTVDHQHDHKDKIYNDFRTRSNTAEIFAKSWGLKMNFTIATGCEIYGKETIPIRDLIGKLVKFS
jgi:hypothetical protein